MRYLTKAIVLLAVVFLAGAIPVLAVPLDRWSGTRNAQKRVILAGAMESNQPVQRAMAQIHRNSRCPKLRQLADHPQDRRSHETDPRRVVVPA